MILDNRLVELPGPGVGYAAAAQRVLTPVTASWRSSLIIVGDRDRLGHLRAAPVPAGARLPLPAVAARKELYGNAINESLLMRPGSG